MPTLPSPTPPPLLPPSAGQLAWQQMLLDSLDPVGWVRPEPFRAHVADVRATTGLPSRVLAVAAGVPPASMTRLMGATPRPLRALDAASMALLTPELVSWLAGRPGPGAAVRCRIDALRRHGCADREIAAWLRATPAQLVAFTEGAGCTALTEVLAAAACSARGLDGVWSLEHWQGHLLRRTRPVGPSRARGREPLPMPHLAA